MQKPKGRGRPKKAAAVSSEEDEEESQEEEEEEDTEESEEEEVPKGIKGRGRAKAAGAHQVRLLFMGDFWMIFLVYVVWLNM